MSSTHPKSIARRMAATKQTRTFRSSSKPLKPVGGRPPVAPALKRVSVPMRLPQWLATWLDEQPEDRATVVIAALVKSHRLKGP